MLMSVSGLGLSTSAGLRADLLAAAVRPERIKLCSSMTTPTKFPSNREESGCDDKNLHLWRLRTEVKGDTGGPHPVPSVRAGAQALERNGRRDLSLPRLRAEVQGGTEGPCAVSRVWVRRNDGRDIPLRRLRTEVKGDTGVRTGVHVWPERMPVSGSGTRASSMPPPPPGPNPTADVSSSNWNGPDCTPVPGVQSPPVETAAKLQVIRGFLLARIGSYGDWLRAMRCVRCSSGIAA